MTITIRSYLNVKVSEAGRFFTDQGGNPSMCPEWVAWLMLKCLPVYKQSTINTLNHKSILGTRVYGLILLRAFVTQYQPSFGTSTVCL